MPRGGFEIGTDPNQVRMALELLTNLFEPKVSRKARQTREALENIAQQKAWQWAPEMRQQYAQALQYEPGILRRAFRPSERAPEYLLSELPFEAKVKTPVKGRMAPAPMDIPSPPSEFRAPVGQERKFMKDGQRWAQQQEWDESSGQWKDVGEPYLADRPPTVSPPIEKGPTIHTFRFPHPKTNEPMAQDREYDYSTKTWKNVGDPYRVHEPKAPKEPKAPPAVPVAATKQLRLTLLRLYLNNPNVWKDRAAQEAALKIVEQIDPITLKGGNLEDAYKLLNSDQRRTFEEVITIAERHVSTLGVTGAVNQALHELRERRPGAFQRREGGIQPPPMVERRTERSLELTPEEESYAREQLQKRGVKAKNEIANEIIKRREGK